MKEIWFWEFSYGGQDARSGRCGSFEAAKAAVEMWARDRDRPEDVSARVWQAGGDDKPAAWVYRSKADTE